MKKRVLMTTGLAVLLLISMVFAACGGNNGAYSKGDGGYYETTAMSTNSYADGYDDEYAEKEDGTAEMANVPVSFTKKENAEKTDREKNQKLVYTCTMRMETTEFAKTLSALKELIEKYDAFVETEEQSDSANSWYYSSYRKTSGTLSERIVIRVPSENYDAFLSDLDGQGKVREKNTKVDNITRSYSDTETIIAALKTQEKRLLEMMDQAETIEDMITVEDRLTEVQQELALYESRLSGMDLDVAYSTVDLTLTEVLEYSGDTEPVYTATFGDRLKNTLKESWETTLEFLEGLLFFLIRALPILLILGVIGLAITFIIVGIVKSSRKRRAAKAAKKQAATPQTAQPQAPVQQNTAPQGVVRPQPGAAPQNTVQPQNPAEKK